MIAAHSIQTLGKDYATMEKFARDKLSMRIPGIINECKIDCTQFQKLFGESGKRDGLVPIKLSDADQESLEGLKQHYLPMRKLEKGD